MSRTVTAQMTLPDGRTLMIPASYAWGKDAVSGPVMTLDLGPHRVTLRPGDTITITYAEDVMCRHCGKPIRQKSVPLVSGLPPGPLAWVHEDGMVYCNPAPKAEP